MVAIERKRPRLINLCYLHQGCIKRRERGTRLQMLHKLYARFSHRDKIPAPRIQTPVSLWDGQNGFFSRKQVSSGGKCESTPVKEKQTPKSRLSKERRRDGIKLFTGLSQMPNMGKEGECPQKSPSKRGEGEGPFNVKSNARGEGETLSGVSQEREGGRKDLVE